MLSPQIDQYLPVAGTAVRNKMTELGIGNNSRMAFNQINTLNAARHRGQPACRRAPAAPPNAIKTPINRRRKKRSTKET